MLKIIFMGTADFGRPVLEKLADSRENIITVITQPDRPQGRGRKILPTPIKKIALDKRLEIFQPENINDEESIKRIKEFSPDIILVVAYGQILSGYILNIPKIGCINIHGSLLPKYRGAAPINRAIINGEKETGITFMFMKEKVDAGEIIFQEKIDILADETCGEIYYKLSDLSARLFPKLLEKIKSGKIERIPQDNRLVTFARKMNKEDGKIDWSDKGEKVYNLIRGTIPYPGTFTYYKGRKLKITRARFLEDYQDKSDTSSPKPGRVVKIEKDSIFISTGDKGIIKILRLIPAGSKELTANQFVNGYKIKEGDVLGE
ncbi:MAG: methionyl-tRNA formyltransferase [Candidatus Caldatribacteriota bacterium]|nr:methionyl-tRNA formyltransferase [Candidatus Caldatribacteriota bacterium]